MVATILFLGANPSDTTHLALDREVREIDQRLYAADRRASFELEQAWAVRAADLQQCLLRYRPAIVHFSGHGSAAGQILLEDEAGLAAPVAPEALSALFRILGRGVRCVVLNACYSEAQARAIAAHVDCVVGMSAAVLDSAAMAFAGAFYQALGHGEDVQTAFELGCNQIELVHGHGGAGASRDIQPEVSAPAAQAEVPKLLVREGVDARQIRLAAAEPARSEASAARVFRAFEEDEQELHIELKKAPPQDGPPGKAWADAEEGWTGGFLGGAAAPAPAKVGAAAAPAPAKVGAVVAPAPAKQAPAPVDARPAPALPVPGPCFGRDAVVAELAAALLGEPAPRISILGPAGVGKTTVSVAVLHRPDVAQRYAERRYFARLDAAADAEAAAGAIAAALQLDPGPELRRRALLELARGPALLVLDNLEVPWDQDSAATEALLAELSSLPRLALVASLRRAVQPGGVSWTRSAQIEPLGEADAVDLFCSIAGEEHRRDPRLPLLLAKQEGVPLAITLLAYAAEGNDLGNVADEWEERRTGLLSREGVSPGRQTSWGASLELSLGSRRMTDDARRLASLLGVLPDGVAQQDLRALFGGAGPGAARVLAQLALAHFDHGRLRALLPVRAHLAAAHPPAAADLARAMEHYRGLAQELGPRPGSAGGAEAAARLSPEVANLDAVLRRGLAGSDTVPWVDAAIALTRFARTTGSATSPLLAQAFEAASAARDTGRSALCLESLGEIASARSRQDEARGLFERALSLYREAGNLLGEANCVFRLGEIALTRSQLDQARACYEQALPLYRQLGDVQGEANCLEILGTVALASSKIDDARRLYEQALPLYRRAGSALGEANCTRSLGDIALVLSNHEQARGSYEKALSLYRQVGDIVGEAGCIWRLGDIAIARAQYREARGCYEQALPLFRRVGAAVGEANCLLGLGDSAAGSGHGDAARSSYEAALAIYAGVPDPHLVGQACRRLAYVAGDATERRAHVEAARAAWTSIGRADLVAALDGEFPEVPRGESIAG